MAAGNTMFDYLDWRGDLPMTAIPMQEIDGMILSRFVYAPFHLTSLKNTTQFVSVSGILKELLAIPNLPEKVLDEGDIALFKALEKSPRFCNLKIGNFVDVFDAKRELQFSACTFEITPTLSCICYRGTDNTLIGWKENFNMGFSCPIPSQELALQYFENYANHTDTSLILVGHSKGGNLAVYASAFCHSEIQQRIQTVYSYDGPGFVSKILSAPGYLSICSKIHTYVPQSSIVGILLSHKEAHSIVHSMETRVPFQHNVYSWCVYGTSFVPEDTLSDTSRYFDSTMRDWLASMSYKQREHFVEGIFSIVSSTNAQTLDDLKNNLFGNSKIIFQNMRSLDEETKAVISEGFSLFMRSAKNSLGILWP